jgi:ethanolamine utilization protein
MRITEELVKYVTAELMKRLGGAVQRSRPRLRLAGSRGDLSTPALARLHENFEIEEHQGWDDPLPPEAAVLITRLSTQALVRVAGGDEGCTPDGRVLLAALLNGQPVAALKDGFAWRRYASTAPQALLARYAQCENILQSYGLKLVSEDEAVRALTERCPAPASPAAAFRPAENAAPAGSRGRRALTESEVMRICPASRGEGQALRLEPGTILTPLAQDYVRAMKINVM